MSRSGDVVVPEDPLQRFLELNDALCADQGWFQDYHSLRFAAVTAVTCPGDAVAVAAAIRETAEEIKAGAGWFGDFNSPLAYLLAAMMVQQDERPRAFREAVERTRKLFRAEKLRRGGIYESMAVWVLRQQAGGRPISASTVRRFKAIYEQMKRYHWWLTGPDDFPACAVLCGQEASPSEIGGRVERLYQALHDRGAARGDPLQTAANLLYLAEGDPVMIAGRFGALMRQFRTAKVSIVQADYDELAILAFVDAPAPDVVETVLRCREPILALRPRPGRSIAFNLACSVAFLELVRLDGARKRAADAKTLVDMQAILQAQQAAAAVAASTAATAAAASS